MKGRRGISRKGRRQGGFFVGWGEDGSGAAVNGGPRPRQWSFVRGKAENRCLVVGVE